MPFTKPTSCLPSIITQKWFGYSASRLAKLNSVAASAAGKHSASICTTAAKSAEVAVLICITILLIFSMLRFSSILPFLRAAVKIPAA
jgi:hypothetical protein